MTLDVTLETNAFSSAFVQAFGSTKFGQLLVLTFMTWLPAGALCAEAQLPKDASCAIERPGKAYSAQDIGAMFERPTNVRQLLRNLKLAGEKDLLLKAGFFTDANLLKFFGGRRITQTMLDTHGLDNITSRQFLVDIDNSSFPGMTVELLHSCQLIQHYRKATGAVPAHVLAVTAVEIDVHRVSGFNVQAVHDVFGTESSKVMDYGVGTDGGKYTPTSKGDLFYSRRDPDLELDTVAFFIKLDSPQALAAGARAWDISGGDEVKNIHMLSRER